MQHQRICSACKTLKAIDEFYVKRRRGGIEHDYECKECARIRLKRLTRAPRTSEQMHEEHIQRVFGITAADYAALLEEQGGGCAVCGATQCSDGRRLHVDHCHNSGRVRGLLCAFCNLAIGKFGDDPDRLRAAASYLENPPARDVLAMPIAVEPSDATEATLF